MKKNIIILHGWSRNLSSEKYDPLKKILEKDFHVFVPDLPGFGNEKLVKDVMNLSDYVDFVINYCKKNNIKKAVFVGHSFGGRVAIKLAATHPEIVEKLIISGTPLIKKRLSIKKRLLSFCVKIGKRLITTFPEESQQKLRKVLYFMIGEWDYYKSGNLRETFLQIISEDLTPYLSQIETNTLLLWGEEDHFVPKEYAIKGKQLLKNARVELIPLATHKVPYENPKVFANHITQFIKT